MIEQEQVPALLWKSKMREKSKAKHTLRWKAKHKALAADEERVEVEEKAQRLLPSRSKSKHLLPIKSKPNPFLMQNSKPKHLPQLKSK